jgi:prepilin-type N-terminal cleavage/methylation domain-containing protein
LVESNTITPHSQHGFTLIELSIVLVIIGLIVGGVLVGQDLIKAAALRAQVAQIEKYNAAINTFRNKYNAVPGDMIPAIASTFGLLQLAPVSVGLQGMGDGNGLLEDGATVGGGPNSNQFAGEISTFWRHLSDANLVDGSFGINGNSAISGTGLVSGRPGGAVSSIPQSIPAAKLGRGLSVTVISGRGQNFFILMPITKISAAGLYAVGSLGMTPLEAQNIDAKIDDGAPNTGIVLAQGTLGAGNTPFAGMTGSPQSLIGGFSPSAATTSTLNKCVISSDGLGDLPTDTYNLVPSTGGNDPSCALSVRFQ